MEIEKLRKKVRDQAFRLVKCRETELENRKLKQKVKQLTEEKQSLAESLNNEVRLAEKQRGVIEMLSGKYEISTEDLEFIRSMQVINENESTLKISQKQNFANPKKPSRTSAFSKELSHENRMLKVEIDHLMQENQSLRREKQFSNKKSLTRPSTPLLKQKKPNFDINYLLKTFQEISDALTDFRIQHEEAVDHYLRSSSGSEVVGHYETKITQLEEQKLSLEKQLIEAVRNLG